MKLLYDYQADAVENMSNGCILCGGVGSGKSRTSLAYYYKQMGGDIYAETPDKLKKPCDLYIITTARKRDTLEWDSELPTWRLSKHDENKIYKHNIIIDSWNNIKKYENTENAFFIFDEQRVIGSGAWVKAFLKITKHNQWILLSATPGDTWQDYIPVFLANGFYKNRSEFIDQHVIYKRFSKFPQVDRYINTGRLIRLRNKILVDMNFDRKTISHHIDVWTNYPKIQYSDVMKNRWDPYKHEPIQNAGVLCYTLRKVVNSDLDRISKIMDIFEKHKRLIIFYNFDYELEILKSHFQTFTITDLLDKKYPYFEVAEWNGHAHQPIPTTDSWVYLVQYNAGAEGWNCIKTDTIIFYSQNYSYKIMEQSAGRIDRLNTPYPELYYYHLKSKSKIDLAISRAIKQKKNFNEGKFGNSYL